MWQSRQCCFYWIHYVDRHFILSFISYSLWPEWTCVNWQRRLMLLSSVWGLKTVKGMFSFCVSVLVHAYIWPQEEVCIFGGKSCTAVEVASPHRDQKSPFTSCGISSWEVLISYRAADTSYLAGRLTCKGIFRLDSSNECSTQAITWPTLHTGRGEITPFFLWLPFSFVLPPLTLFCLPFSLSWKLSPAMSGALSDGGGEMCHTAS